jgi:hypothetical protein
MAVHHDLEERIAERDEGPDPMTSPTKAITNGSEVTAESKTVTNHFR